MKKLKKFLKFAFRLVGYLSVMLAICAIWDVFAREFALSQLFANVIIFLVGTLWGLIVFDWSEII